MLSWLYSVFLNCYLCHEIKFIGSNNTNALDLTSHCKEKIVKMNKFLNDRSSKPSQVRFVLQLEAPFGEIRKIHGPGFDMSRYGKIKKVTKSIIKRLLKDPLYLKCDTSARRLFEEIAKQEEDVMIASFKTIQNIMLVAIGDMRPVVEKRNAEYLKNGVHADLMTNEDKKTMLRNNPGNTDLVEYSNKRAQFEFQRTNARHESPTSKTSATLAKLNRLSDRLKHYPMELQDICFQYAESKSFRNSSIEMREKENLVKAERKAYAKIERAKLMKRIKNRKEREEVLKENVPDDCIKSFRAFQAFYERKKNLSYTKKQRFLSSAMVRLKILIKTESTDAAGNVTVKPDKSINPTAIIRDTKSGGKPDKKKILGKLINGVRMLIALRKTIEV